MKAVCGLDVHKDSIFELKNAWLNNVMSMFIPLFNILWLNPLY